MVKGHDLFDLVVYIFLLIIHFNFSTKNLFLLSFTALI